MAIRIAVRLMAIQIRKIIDGFQTLTEITKVTITEIPITLITTGLIQDIIKAIQLLALSKTKRFVRIQIIKVGSSGILTSPMPTGMFKISRKNSIQTIRVSQIKNKIGNIL